MRLPASLPPAHTPHRHRLQSVLPLPRPDPADAPSIQVTTRKVYAIKRISLEDSDDDISEIQEEISLLSGCDSEWVTRYYGSFLKGWELWIGAADHSIDVADGGQ